MGKGLPFAWGQGVSKRWEHPPQQALLGGCQQLGIPLAWTCSKQLGICWWGGGGVTGHQSSPWWPSACRAGPIVTYLIPGTSQDLGLDPV